MRRAWVAVAALTLCAATAACGRPAPQDGAMSEAAATSPTAGGDANPVLGDDFPDPDVLEVDGTYFAYATNANLDNVQVARSTDLIQWEPLEDALPDLPTWVIPGKTWAPEVMALDDGSYVLYFTATNFDPTLQCIGVATADDPAGPFTVVGEQMLVCPAEEGGAIDAATFRDDDGTAYLLWKNDGNCCGHDTWIYAAPLAADGLTLAGEPTRLIKQDQTWEGHLVEAPTLVKRDGAYVLLYSANDYGGAEYAIGYATASAPAGPYEKAPGPLLTTQMTGGRFVGPGGQDVVVGPDGQDRLVFHSWYGEETYRALNVLPLRFEDGRPEVVLP